MPAAAAKSFLPSRPSSGSTSAAAGILNDPQRMETMSQNMAALGIPDATKRIYDTVMTLLK